MVARLAERVCPWFSQPYARYTQHKTAHKHPFHVYKHTIDKKKSELEARCLRSTSTVHNDKTGNKIDRKNDVFKLTEGSYSVFH